MLTRSSCVPSFWCPILVFGSISLKNPVKSPKFGLSPRALFNTNKNWAPSDQIVRVGKLFAAPWSSKLQATLTFHPVQCSQYIYGLLKHATGLLYNCYLQLLCSSENLQNYHQPAKHVYSTKKLEELFCIIWIVSLTNIQNVQLQVSSCPTLKSF